MSELASVRAARLGPNAYEAIFRHSSDAVMFTAPDGRVLAANPAACRVLDLSEAEICARGRSGLIDPEDPGWSAAVEERSRTGHVRRQLRMRRGDGQSFVADITSNIFLDEDGASRACVIFRDVTDHVRADQKLRYLGELTQALLAGESTQEMMTGTARHARVLVHADRGWVVSLRPDSSSVVVLAGDGPGAGEFIGTELPSDTTLAGHAISSNRTVVVRDLASDPHVAKPGRLLGGPSLVVPLTTGQHRFGTLVVARCRERPPFSSSEVEALESFAQSVALALTLGEARAEIERFRLMEDHERIARDLHDSVIQRLFTIGLGLQGVQHLASGALSDRLVRTLTELDETIREIRETIFDLEEPPEGPDFGDRARTVVEEAGELLGFDPQLRFEGPVDVLIDSGYSEQVLSVLREALSNVVRHARATRVEVVIVVNDHVALAVDDDGVGVSGPGTGRGLHNLKARAEQLGGTFSLTPRAPHGTSLMWRVPLPPGGETEPRPHSAPRRTPDSSGDSPLSADSPRQGTKAPTGG
jgi:PAS domain S-box-containing protein